MHQIQGHGRRKTRSASTAVVSACCLALLVGTGVMHSATAQSTSPNSDSPTYLHAIDPLGITQNIISGNSDRLQVLSQSSLPQATHAYALAGYYRSIFKLKLSTQYAKQCYADSIKALPKLTVDALRCGEIIAGNQAILGHTAAWARSMQAVRNKLYPIATNSLHSDDVIFPGFGSITERIDMHSFYGFPDETIAGAEGSDIVIPRVLPSGDRPRENEFETAVCQFGIRCFGKYLYDIDINVNGHNIVAVVDTGSTTSIVSPSAAHEVGVRDNSSPYYELQSSQSARSPSHLGYVDSLKIRTNDGHDILLKDSKVKVGGLATHNIKMILGLNVLREMGSVLLKKNNIIINPRQLNVSCGMPLHISSDLFGGYSVMFDYPIDGSLQSVMVDTGENQYVFGTSLANARRVSSEEMVTYSEHVTGNVEAIYYPAIITFGKGAHAKSMTVAVFPDYKKQYPYIMGSEILQDFDIFLDFKEARACLIPRS